MIIKGLLEEQPQTETRNELLNNMDMKIRDDTASYGSRFGQTLAAEARNNFSGPPPPRYILESKCHFRPPKATIFLGLTDPPP